MIKAVIGFSANPEIIVRINRFDEFEKAPLNEMTCELGGTSANFAKALGKMGIESELYALTGCNDDFNTHCLKFALKKSHEKIHVFEFPIMDQGHMGFIPIDGTKKTSQVFGLKGIIQSTNINDCINIIKKKDTEKNIWRVATGVRSAEVELVKALFGDKHKGFRYLNPRIDLIQSKEIFFSLLEQTDILVMNHAEYEACTHYKEIGSRADIQKNFGVSLVIVTKDKDGGKFSLINQRTNISEKFDACIDYITDAKEIFPTGTGDWFGGALISYLIKTRKSIFEISEKEIKEAILFASKIAGKKVTMRGAGNGPAESDL